METNLINLTYKSRGVPIMEQERFLQVIVLNSSIEKKNAYNKRPMLIIALSTLVYQKIELKKTK